MKRKEFEELKTKPEVELREMLREIRERLRALKFDLAAGKTKNARELKSLKKNIARILTILREANK